MEDIISANHVPERIRNLGGEGAIVSMVASLEESRRSQALRSCSANGELCLKLYLQLVSVPTFHPNRYCARFPIGEVVEPNDQSWIKSVRKGSLVYFKQMVKERR